MHQPKFFRIAGMQFSRFTLFFLILIIFFSARFIHLLADFPSGFNWSGDLFTDEGWYSSGAVRFLTSGHWIVNGDFNPVISMPVFQFTVFLGFKLLGVSILSARIVALAFFLVLIGVTFLLIRSEWGILPAFLSLAFLCSDFIIFIYSRLAFLEIPMLTFVMLSLYIYKVVRSTYLQIIITGIVLFLGMLTKTTAVFAIPAFLFLLWTEDVNLNNKIKRSIIFIFFLLVPYLIYSILTNYFFQQDVKYFSVINFSERITLQFELITKNFYSIFRDLKNLHPLILWLVIFSALLIVFVNREFIRSRWIIVLVLSLLSYITILSVTYYHPLRYYIPLLFILCILCGVFLGKVLSQKANPNLIRLFSISLTCVFLIVNSLSILYYLSSPNYSFITMVRQVTEQILSSDQPSPILIGPFANTVSLESGIFSVNSHLGVWDIQKKMEVFQPTHFISFADDQLINELSNQYVFSPVAEFRVLENYYNGKNVILYKVTKAH